MALNRPHPAAPVDAALLALRLLEARVCQSMLRAPWGLAAEATPTATLFAVARGRVDLRCGDTHVALRAGDVAFLPHGDACTLTDADGTAPLPPEALRFDPERGRCVLDAGGDGPLTHLVSGVLAFETSPVLAGLPALVHLPAEAEGLAGVAALLVDEATDPGPGTEVVLTHLVGLLAVGAVRQWLTRAPSEPFLRALHHPSLRRALEALHADPAHRWTLPALAKVAGMSRSAFAQQFTDTIGTPPMRYWAQWRLTLAREGLRDGRWSVEQAADALGYRSRAAFARAYKAALGEPPGATRRRGRPPLRTLHDQLAEAHP